MFRIKRISIVVIIVILIFGSIHQVTSPIPVQASNIEQVQEYLFYIFASGNKEIQDEAYVLLQSLGFPQNTFNQISQLTRETHLNLLQFNRTRLGLPTEKTDDILKGKEILSQMETELQKITGRNYKSFLEALKNKYRETSSSSFIEKLKANSIDQSDSISIQVTNPKYFVWASSYSQSSFPKNWPNYPDYVALPDAYLKFANWTYYGSDWSTGIPSAYKPYYSNAPYSVWVSKDDSTYYNATVIEVGPWNEDDNWWDPTNSPTTSIQPNGTLWRRVYYYLLYKHDGTYKPTGTFTSSNPPYALGNMVPEAEDAYDVGYNGGNGAWTRAPYYYSPVGNRAGIDISPELSRDLGWTYPSSGWVWVKPGNLP
ncbi:hypothetical protein [Paradesulfitobacterium ferrireducens]|uniref:hypothetical protein n=1 Tax=Paradesulfitobacterium ferrireducens TaxID=2816476 RepID=UPI001A8E9D90|nr:hypothetical protein [Paradesulfitobacterium ferrireducens]